MPLQKWKCACLVLSGFLFLEESPFAAGGKTPQRYSRAGKKKQICPDQLPAQSASTDINDSLAQWLKNEIPRKDVFPEGHLEALIVAMESGSLDRDFQLSHRDFNFLKAVLNTNFQASQVGRVVDMIRDVRLQSPEMSLDGASIVKILELKERVRKLQSKIERFEANHVVTPAGVGKQLFIYSSRSREMQELLDALMAIKMVANNVPIAGQSRLTLSPPDAKLVLRAFSHFINDDDPDLIVISIAIELAKRDRSGLLDESLKTDAQKILAKSILELQKYKSKSHLSAYTLSSVAAEIINMALMERIHPLPIFTEFNLIVNSPAPYLAKSIISFIMPPAIPVSFSFHLETVKEIFLSMSESSADVCAQFINLLFLAHVGSSLDEFHRREHDMGGSRDLMARLLYSDIGRAADEMHAFMVENKRLRFVMVLGEFMNVEALIPLRDLAQAMGLAVQGSMPLDAGISSKISSQIVSLYNPDKRPFVQKILGEELLR